MNNSGHIITLTVDVVVSDSGHWTGGRDEAQCQCVSHRLTGHRVHLHGQIDEASRQVTASEDSGALGSVPTVVSTSAVLVPRRLAHASYATRLTARSAAVGCALSHRHRLKPSDVSLL